MKRTRPESGACVTLAALTRTAFQIVDDVLDVTQSSEQLGKTAGKDTASEKATYPSLFGIEESMRRADALVMRGTTMLLTHLLNAHKHLKIWPIF